MTLVVLAAFPIVLMGSLAGSKVMKKTESKANDGDEKGAALLSEAVNNMRTVVAFNMGNYVQSTYQGFIAESLKDELRMGIIGGAVSGFSTFLIFGSLGGLFYVGGLLVTSGHVSFSDKFLVIMVVFLGAQQLGRAQSAMTDAMAAQTAVRKLFSIIDRVPAINAASNTGNTAQEMQGTVTFSHIKFAYPTRPNTSIYRDFNLIVNAGQTVALVGASGKCTVVAGLRTCKCSPG